MVVHRVPVLVLAVLMICGCAAYAVEALTDPETATAVAVGYLAFLATIVILLRVLRKR